MPRLGDVVEAAERERRGVDESLIGFRRGEQQPGDGREEEEREGGEGRPPHRPRDDGSHSSLLNSPLRVTTRTAAATPMTSRSTEIAAAPLKSPNRKAIWYASWFDDQ